MPRIAAVALASPVGDLQATMQALYRADPSVAGPLGQPLTATLIRLGHEVLGDRRPDLILLATTKAETGRWCASLLSGPECYAGGPTSLAAELGQAFSCRAYAVSAACASSPAACTVAARMLCGGTAQRVLVLAGDEIGPFVHGGFTALRALDPSGCHPFDHDRAGLALGETAAALLLEAVEPAGPQDGCFLAGWGGSLDANHLTGPTRDGSGLGRALERASAGLGAPALIIGHGTGTRYNDDSESMAYARLYPGVPVTGYKGLLGHSLGACGLAELAIATAILTSNTVPGTVGLSRQGCAGAIHVLPPGTHALGAGDILLANAGFGGMNGALRLSRRPPPPVLLQRTRPGGRTRCDASGWWSWSAEGLSTSGVWQDRRTDGLPRITASEALDRVDALWGRMDLACRTLVALAIRSGPLPANSALVLVTERGCAASDRVFEQGRLGSGCDPQRFPYTLPSTPVGEASIRLGIQGPGITLLGASDGEARQVARDLVAQGAPAALLARVEADSTLEAWTETWMPETL